VDIDAFTLKESKEDYYVTASRFVPYKKIDIVVDAFRSMPDRTLYVIGDGPDEKKIRGLAGSNVTLLGYQPTSVLIQYLQGARAFIFAAEEDFGILPVEAQACGTPVIAYRKGAVTETVREGDGNAPTGIFFERQTPEAICQAITEFEATEHLFEPRLIRQHAESFAIERFRREFSDFVEDTWIQFQERLHQC